MESVIKFKKLRKLFFHQCQENDKKYENYLPKEKYHICCTSHSLIVHEKLITSEKNIYDYNTDMALRHRYRFCSLRIKDNEYWKNLFACKVA